MIQHNLICTYVLCREDGLLECLRIGDFHSILSSSRSKAFDNSSILEPIVSVKQEPRTINPSQDYLEQQQQQQQQYWGRGEQWEDEDYRDRLKNGP